MGNSLLWENCLVYTRKHVTSVSFFSRCQFSLQQDLSELVCFLRFATTRILNSTTTRVYPPVHVVCWFLEKLSLQRNKAHAPWAIKLRIGKAGPHKPYITNRQKTRFVRCVPSTHLPLQWRDTPDGLRHVYLQLHPMNDTGDCIEIWRAELYLRTN